MTTRLSLLLTLAAAFLAGCTSLDDHVAQERARDRAVFEAGGWPEESVWVVVADGEAVGSIEEKDAYEIAPRAQHRYVFRPEETGDRRVRMAFLNTAEIIAGQEFADALGLTLRRDSSGRAILTHGVRRVTTPAGGKVILRMASPDGAVDNPAAVLLDPDFQGPVLLSRGVAEILSLRRFEIPGDAYVDVALGRPFTARRSRVIVTIEELDVSGSVDALFRQ